MLKAVLFDLGNVLLYFSHERMYAQIGTLIYLGFFFLMLLFALLYLHAYRRRTALDLGPLEAFDARLLAGHHLVSAAVGLFATLFALVAPASLAFLSPSSFALMGPGHWGYGKWVERRRRAFAASLATPPPVAT